MRSNLGSAIYVLYPNVLIWEIKEFYMFIFYQRFAIKLVLIDVFSNVKSGKNAKREFKL